MVAIGGWETGLATFSKLAADQNARSQFAQNVANV